MGCNLNEFAFCANKCDCGDMNTKIGNEFENVTIQSEKKRKSLKKNNYIDSKIFFQFINENNNKKKTNSNNFEIFKDGNGINTINIKKEEINNNTNINLEINDKESKINNYNKCLNNVTIEAKGQNNESI